MKKVIFYIENGWAFGSIHNELAKYLFEYDVNCLVMDWKIQYSVKEMEEITGLDPLWVTVPQGVDVLVGDYLMKPKNILLVAHAMEDIDYFSKNLKPSDYRGFIVISEFLADRAVSLGLERPPVLHIGVNVNDYQFEPSQSLQKVGFAGSTIDLYSHNKRHRLVEQACHQTGLEFVVAHHYHNSFVTMPGFYRNVDSVVVSSCYEGDGMVSLEAGAAGKLVISTSVGHWPELCSGGGGLELPIDEELLLQQLVIYLSFYKDNPDLYVAECRKIQQYAQGYDWSNVVEKWARVFKEGL